VVVFGLLLIILPLRPPLAYAAGDLEIAAEAVYTIDPEASRLEISVHFTLTNLKPRSGNISYYYDRYSLVVPDNAEDVSTRNSLGRLQHLDRVLELDDGSEGRVVTVLTGSFFYKESRDFTISFALPTGAPRSEDTIRVNPAYTAFPAHAWGDPGLSDVEVRIPGDFTVDFYGLDVARRRSEGSTVLTSTDIPNPDGWYLLVTGRRDAALVARTIESAGLAIEVLSWPGDDAWADRVVGVVSRGLPELRSRIGLEFEEIGSLSIIESIDPTRLGYAGWYLADGNLIEMSEHLDDHVILHELAHIWFNQSLFVERWINEGLADTFADQIVDAIGAESDPEYGTAYQPTPNLSAAVRLNEWRPPNLAPGDDEAVAAREQYGYNASHWVMRALQRDVGPEGMNLVFLAALADETAYRGAGEPELVAETDDWRRFLDLLEELAGSDDAEGLFREYIVADAQRVALTDRAAARERYATHLEAAEGWATPWSIRQLMSDWRFDAAIASLDTGDALLAVRGDLREVAADLGLSLTESLEQAYETSSESAALDRALRLGQTQFESITSISQARAAVDAPRGFFARIGLIGENPELEWMEAADRFAVDDLEGAIFESNEVIGLIDRAAHIGEKRVLWASSGFAGLLLFGGGGTWLVVGLRRRRQMAVISGAADQTTSDLDQGSD
jgi:hypothetical protein